MTNQMLKHFALHMEEILSKSCKRIYHFLQPLGNLTPFGICLEAVSFHFNSYNTLNKVDALTVLDKWEKEETGS